MGDDREELGEMAGSAPPFHPLRGNCLLCAIKELEWAALDSELEIKEGKGGAGSQWRQRKERSGQGRQIGRLEVGRPAGAYAWEKGEEDKVRMTRRAHLVLYIK